MPIYFLSSRHPQATETHRRLDLLCFAVGVLCRRVLYDSIPPSFVRESRNFVNGFFQLFRGEIVANRAEDNTLLDMVVELRECIRNAARLTVRIVQESYIAGDDYSDVDTLYQTVHEYNAEKVVFPESDAGWTHAIKQDAPTLLSMRRRDNESTRVTEHSFVRLNMRYTKFRAIKLNREGVRAMWAAQQQELIYIGNRNEERGSIQQMRSTARNLVTQACDLPVGYPIYVSGLVTSYASTPTPLHTDAWAKRVRG